jgi:spermidine synthase
MAQITAARASFYVGVALVTGATLMMQLIMTRILSVMAWYHLAFFAISIAMFGMTAGAVWVYLRKDRFVERTSALDLSYFCTAFALGSILSALVLATLVPVVERSLTAVISWVELAICMAVPYFFSGIVVSLALTRSPYPVPRVYGADMIGAAVGCLGVLALLNTVDAVSALLWTAALAALGAVLFRSSSAASGPPTGLPMIAVLGRPGKVAVVLIALAAANSLSEYRLHLLAVKQRVELRGGDLLFERWNSFSRIAVSRYADKEPHLWGRSPTTPRGRWEVDQRRMNIDGIAGTTMYRDLGSPPNAGFLKYDITNLAYALPDRPRVGIIGVGGGRDILSAMVFGRTDITAVEINPIFVDLLTREPGFADYAGLAARPGLELIADEGRSWYARTGKSFDIIQMTLVDTFTATGAGAFTLSENGLYTVEGWKIFLSRLSPRGVFTVTRWYAPGAVNETGRMISVTVAALSDMGAKEFHRHIFLVASDDIATLVVSRQPLEVSDVAALERAASDLEFKVLLSPSGQRGSEVLSNIVSARTRGDLERYTSGLDLDLTPATDNRPFFFNQLRLDRPLQVLKLARRGFYQTTGGVVSGNLSATATLLMLLVVALVLVVAVIVVPLRNAIKDVGKRLVIGGSFYFLLIGIGFMSVEIGLLQRMSVFLGHPIYSLSIVLFTLILATGVGSLVSDKLTLDSRAKFVVWSVLTGGYTLTMLLWLPHVLTAFEGASLLGRALICVATISPIGMLMGFGFPTGMRLVANIDRRPTPWFWGINGAAGVLSAILAVAFSMAYGIGFTLTVGAICYFLLIPFAITLGVGQQARRGSEAGQLAVMGHSPATQA